MKTNGKFIIQVTGPGVKYRLDIMKDAYTKISDFIIIVTNRESYPLYKDYHEFFTFVFFDDYRDGYPESKKYEVFPSYKTEEEYFENIPKFYNRETDTHYSYDIHRFGIQYMIDNDILNFATLDTDFILMNDPEMLTKFFDNIKPGTCYGPWHGEDFSAIERKLEMWKTDVQPFFPQIKLESPFLRTVDGYTRGFHFRNKEELQLMYDLWNTTLEICFSIKDYRHDIVGNNGVFYHTEWVISHIMQFFEHQLNYTFKDSHELFDVDHVCVGRHCTRPEDTFYFGKRPGWEHLNFNYSDTKNISGFIKNNKSQLLSYYGGKYPIINITDTHVYTKFV